MELRSDELADEAVESIVLQRSRFRIGAEIGATIYESEAFNFLDAPVERVTGADIPMPYAANLEKDAIPVPDNVISAVQKVCYRA